MNGHPHHHHPPGTVLLEPPVDEDNSDDYYDNNYGIYNTAMSRNISWEYRNVTLTRVPGYGFGIAVSGGSDNPHFANGDPAIAISDVLKGGPAEGKLSINDRIITANSIKLENVDYGTAVQVLRDSGPSVSLIIKRRIIAHHTKLTLNKLTTTKLKHIQPSDFGVNLTLRVYIKESKNVNLVEGDEVVSINGLDVAKLFDFRKGVGQGQNKQGGGGGGEGGGKLELGVVKQGQQNGQQNGHDVHHHQQQSYDSNCGNLYVQPPTRRRREGAGGVGEDETPVRPPLPDLNSLTPPPPPPPPNHPSHPTSPRFINFLKKGGCPLGLKLIGGNHTGVFVGALQPLTPAASSGLVPGDRILRVNDTDFTSLPRESAVCFLSSLKPDTLVSFIVRTEEGYREILSSEQYHDLLYYRVGGRLEGHPRGSILLIHDTLSPATPTPSWEGLVLSKGDGRVASPQKIHLSKPQTSCLVLVKRVKIGWARPVVIFSLLTEYIHDCLGKVGGRRRFCVVGGAGGAEGLKAELRNLQNSNVHGLVVVRTVEGLEALGDFCPVVIVVKTEDKGLLKKGRMWEGGGAGGSGGGGGGKGGYSLLRSFNKSTATRRSLEELDTLEAALGAWVDKTITITSADNLGEIVGRAIEQIVSRGDVGWVESNNASGEFSGHGEHQNQSFTATQFEDSPAHAHLPTPPPPTTTTHSSTSRHSLLDIPNYNIPPPYALPLSHSRNDNHSSLASPYQQIHTILPKQPRQPPKQPPSQIRQLAHSPEFPDHTIPPPPTTTTVLAPQIDRTKKPPKNYHPNGNLIKPIQNQTQQKPIPPPKPKLISNKNYNLNSNSGSHDDGYYLNLPLNSKIFQNNSNLNSNSAFASFTNSRSFVGNRENSNLPLLQPNTTSGTFNHEGGVLTQRNVKMGAVPVEVVIPEGAIARGKSETIYFHVVEEGLEDWRGVGGAQGEDIMNGNLSIISPLIKFGPENLRFLKPIEIRIPQYNRNLNGNVNNAKVLLNSEQSWSRVDIKGGSPWMAQSEHPLKIVSLTVQKF